MEIQNTLPEEQSKLIFENQEVIRNKFEDYVLSVDSMEKDNNNYLFSTFPLFPEGIEKIKQIQQVREEMKSFTLNNTDKKENTELTQANSTDEYLIAEKSKTEEKGNSEEPSLKEYKYLTARIVELERKTEYEEGDLEELVALRSRAQSILTVEQKEHIIEFLKTQSAYTEGVDIFELNTEELLLSHYQLQESFYRFPDYLCFLYGFYSS